MQTTNAPPVGLAQLSIEMVRSERMRIARELHDRMGFSIAGISMGLAAIEAANEAAVNRIRADLAQLLETMHDVVEDLRAADTPRGLLRSVAQDWASRESGRCVCIEIEPAIEERLSAPAREILCDILREALTNITRHAREAGNVQIHLCLSPDGRARMMVRDDGPGIPPVADRRGWGLVGIAERVTGLGSFQVDRRSDGPGTILLAEIDEALGHVVR